MKKPIAELIWIDPDPAKKIFGCTVIAIILLCAALIHYTVEDWASPRSWSVFIVPILLLVPMLGQYLFWQKTGTKKPKITLNQEGFCIGKRPSLFRLNAVGKRKWGKPHLFLWEDIQFIELDDRDPEVNIFRWTLKTEVTTPDAPPGFVFGRYRSAGGNQPECHAEEALELMVLLMTRKGEVDRRSVIEQWNAKTTPTRSIEELEPEEREVAEALIKERDQLIEEAGELELHHSMDTESVDREELGDLFERASEANRILRKLGVTPPTPKLGCLGVTPPIPKLGCLGSRQRYGCAALAVIVTFMGLIYFVIQLSS